jgi:uncharacterized delta-60 repeat protein
MMLTCCLMTTTIVAASGALDVSFGESGKFHKNFFGSTENATAIATQSDGKIVIVGNAYRDATATDIMLSRYQEDGSPDPSFGIGGVVTADFFHGSEYAVAVAIQPDDKILVAARVSVPPDRSFGVLRFKKDGKLDKTFGEDGIAAVDFFNFSESVNNLAIQPDGKIIVVGEAGQPGVGHVTAIVRFLPDGNLDSGFGAGGKVTSNFGDPNAFAGIIFSQATDVALQNDGKIVIVGESLFLTSNDFVVARYLSNGAIDEGFGTGGLVRTDFQNSTDLATAVDILNDGKILVGGFAYDGPVVSFDFALARYNTDGSLDTSFNHGGKVVRDFSGDADKAYAMIVNSSGKILLAGESFSPTTGYDFALSRFNPDGSLDLDFGTDGRVKTDFMGQTDTANSLLVQKNGKIILVGSAQQTFYINDLAIARYTGEGPRITNIKLKGSKLLISGEFFDLKAKVFIDGVEYQPRSQDESSAKVKRVSLGSGPHEVKVVNPDGQFGVMVFTVP